MAWFGRDCGVSGGLRFANNLDSLDYANHYYTVVSGFDTVTLSAGAPDGVQGGLGNGGQQMQMRLYDCQSVRKAS